MNQYIDMWLDNLMLGAQQAYVFDEVYGRITKAEVIKTEDIPLTAAFNPLAFMQEGHRILNFVRQFAYKTGTSYWIYKGGFQTTA